MTTPISDRSWLKPKGYLHITGRVNINANPNGLANKICDKGYIKRHAFFPLLHCSVSESKYKKRISPIDKSFYRSHCKIENNRRTRDPKVRPLHYATHFDALIFAYYGACIQKHYEDIVSNDPYLNESILAYRKIPILNSKKNKGTIHFANEVFTTIGKKVISEQECVVLTFDLESFFNSLDHDILKNSWIQILPAKDRKNRFKLPDDHFQVFKATTDFSYINKEELKKLGSSKRNGFDEKRLANIRNEKGIFAFFSTPEEFRTCVKSGAIRVHKNPFQSKISMRKSGIPQGLPISSTLANLYLLEFDKDIIENIVKKGKGTYRRYSDDIILICRYCDYSTIESYIRETILKYKVALSEKKTERFCFSNMNSADRPVIKFFKIDSESNFTSGSPFTYLGFEFDGINPRIKSANLAKFYRRMVYAVKSKSNRALKAAKKNEAKPILFIGPLYRLYTRYPLKVHKTPKRHPKLVPNDKGGFKLANAKNGNGLNPKKKALKSNYLSYVGRASEIMKSQSIYHQLRNHKKIFYKAIRKHFWNKLP